MNATEAVTGRIWFSQSGLFRLKDVGMNSVLGAGRKHLMPPRRERMKPVGQEPVHRGHDPFAGAPAANIDVAVVGVPAKVMTASSQFLVEVVKHEIA